VQHHRKRGIADYVANRVIGVACPDALEQPGRSVPIGWLRG
jgi:hypothetical protein